MKKKLAQLAGKGHFRKDLLEIFAEMPIAFGIKYRSKGGYK
jgi:hypothetical protein